MTTFNYGRVRDTASRLLAKFAQGAVTLTRTTVAASEPSTPWLPGAPTTTVYALDATVRGVSQDLVDGTTILASDLEVTAGPLARNTTTGVTAALTPRPSDTISIDGKVHALKLVKSIPAAGVAAVHKLVVAG